MLFKIVQSVFSLQMIQQDKKLLLNGYFFPPYSSFSGVVLPEEECAFSLFFLPQQGQRQGLVLTAALMEGLKLWR